MHLFALDLCQLTLAVVQVYDPIKKARVAKASCAAIIVQVVRPGAEKRHKVEIYSETFARQAGEEYGLQDALKNAISNAVKCLKVDPMCCVVWRDGTCYLCILAAFMLAFFADSSFCIAVLSQELVTLPLILLLAKKFQESAKDSLGSPS